MLLVLFCYIASPSMHEIHPHPNCHNNIIIAKHILNTAINLCPLCCTQRPQRSRLSVAKWARRRQLMSQMLPYTRLRCLPTDSLSPSPPLSLYPSRVPFPSSSSSLTCDEFVILYYMIFFAWRIWSGDCLCS